MNKKDQFVARASKTFALTEEEVVELLKAKFKSFKPEATATYLAYLNTVAQDRYLAEFDKRRKEEHPKTAINNCPYHPEADVLVDVNLYDRYNRIMGWVCSVGERRCHIRWKMDEMFKAVGREPIDWKEFDENKTIIIERRLKDA